MTQTAETFREGIIRILDAILHDRKDEPSLHESSVRAENRYSPMGTAPQLTP